MDDEDREVLEWLTPKRPNEDDFPLNLDVDRVFDKLFQGAVPPQGDLLARLGFDVVVLCANEYQPRADLHPGVELIYMPTDDYDHIPPTNEHIEKVQATAALVVKRLLEGKAVLVTCQMGWNRSGLVTATALHLWHGWSGERCVVWLKQHREDALYNKRFAIHIKSLRERT